MRTGPTANALNALPAMLVMSSADGFSDGSTDGSAVGLVDGLWDGCWFNGRLRWVWLMVQRMVW